MAMTSFNPSTNAQRCLHRAEKMRWHVAHCRQDASFMASSTQCSSAVASGGCGTDGGCADGWLLPRVVCSRAVQQSPQLQPDGPARAMHPEISMGAMPIELLDSNQAFPKVSTSS